MKKKIFKIQKSISLILIFTFIFQYISFILPFIITMALTIEDNNGIEWEYYISNNEAVNVRLADKTVTGSIVVPEILGGYPVKIIGSNAFEGADMVKSITIPECVENIGNNCFKNCDDLETINIRSNTVNNLVGQFNGLERLKNIIVSENNPNYTVDNTGILFNKDQTRLIKCPEASQLVSYDIPSTVTYIYPYCFYNCQNLTSIGFSEAMTNITENTFVNCFALSSVIIPGNITTISNSAFEGCNCLENVTIKEGVQTIKSKAFQKDNYSTWKKTNVYLPDSLTTIESNNFNLDCIIWVNKGTKGEIYARNKNITYYYKNREQYTDEDGITWEYNVRDGAFAEYLEIKNGISAPNYELEIPRTVGENNYKVKIIDSGTPLRSGNSSILSSGKDNIKNAIIPEGVTTIGVKAFNRFRNMETIIIPSSVTSIGENAFDNCDNLTIICELNSEAYRYAIANNISVMSTITLTFNDQNLYNKIKQIVNEKGYHILEDDNINKKLKLKSEDINNIKTLDISNSNITDIKGLGALTSLEELNVSGNSLLGIYNETLRINTLQKLDLSNNNINVITEYLTNLKELNLSNNNIESLENINFARLGNLEELNLSNNKIENYNNDAQNLIQLKQLKKLKTVNLDNNFIQDITALNEMQDDEEYSLENVSLKNQEIVIYTMEKENKIDDYLQILTEAKTARYSNGTNVTFDTTDCQIVDDKIIVSNMINSTDRFASITIHGGKIDGTICTIKPYDIIELDKKIEGDRLTLQALFIANKKPYLLYSIDGSQYMEYEEFITLSEGIHNVKIKLFDNEILNFDTDDIKIDFYAIRKNEKVYLYSNSSEDKYYSFEENGSYQKYTQPIANNSAEKIYVRLGQQNSIEIIIQNTGINSEDEYTIYDVNKGTNKLNLSLRVDFIRENGRLYFCVPDTWKNVRYSVDNENWNNAAKDEKIEIGNEDIEVVYFSYYDEHEARSYHATIRTKGKYSLKEILGIYKENGNSNIFSQDRKSSVNNDCRLQLINDENKIRQIDYNISDITKIIGSTFLLKDDGKVYELMSENNNIVEIKDGTNIKSISNIYALDNNNNILKLDLGDNPIRYKPYDIYTLTKPAKKILLQENSEEITENQNDILYVLYEDGTVDMLVDTYAETLSSRAIDASIEFGKLYILEYNKVKIYGDGLIELDINNLLQDGEIPIKINNNGDILTHNGNVYSIVYRVEQRTDLQGYHYNVNVPDSYSNTNKILNVKKLGNDSYEDKNGNIYYLYHEYTNIQAVQANKLISGINVSKDESNIEQNIVKINIQFEANRFNVKLPDGTQTSNSITYEVNENGEYVFEFTDSEGYKFIRVVHVTNIQDRKQVKVPEVIALNKTIELRSEKTIEYSLDDKNSWNNYSNPITYTRPIYARIKSDEYKCNIIKIILNEQGKLGVLNEDTREIQPGILTNAIGRTTYQIYNDNTKIIKMAQDAAQTISNVQIQENPFRYISNLVDDIIYSFSATDGKYAGCYFDDNITEMTYKDIDNKIIDFNDESSLNDIAEINSYIDYAIIKDNYVVVDKDQYEALADKTDENIDQIAKNLSTNYNNRIAVKKQLKNYAYIDIKGNLVSNIRVISKLKQQIGSSTKFVKIVGDGDTFYVLTEEGEVYYLSEADNGNYIYAMEKFRINNNLKEYFIHKEDIIYKLAVNDIADIYDTLTAKTKNGEIISLINETKQNTSAVQEIQKQTDKYLLSSHLGLKDGKLYNFDDVQHGVEVTKGEIYKVEDRNNSIGIYSSDTKELKLYQRSSDSEPYISNLAEGESYINIQAIDGTLPEFIDIVEYRDTYLARPSYTMGWNSNIVYIDSKDSDKYAKCFAITKDGNVYAYMNGFAVETDLNLDYFGPIANYKLSNSNWTNQNINLNLIPNTTNKIKTVIFKKNDEIIESINKDNGEGIEREQIAIETNGTYSYEITDNKERSYSGSLKVSNIDKLKPNSPSIETEGDKLKVTFNDDKEATEDYAKSGIKQRFISYDGTNWTIVNQDVNLLDVESVVTVYAKTIDNAGNESDIVSGRKNVRTGVVVAKYQDMEGNEIKADKLYTGNVGEDYKTEKAEFEIYEFVEVEGNEQGKYSKEDIIVIYKYNKKHGNVIIIYQDNDGNIIKPKDVITGKIGENYNIQRQIIDGYKMVEIIGNEQGKYQLTDQFIIYKYKKIEATVTIPQTGQSRFAYIIVGIVIIASLCGLTYIKFKDSKSKK